MVRCNFQILKTLFLPEHELLKFLTRKAWKFQAALASAESIFLVVALGLKNEVTSFSVGVSLVFRCMILLSGKFSSKFFVAGCTACMVVDSVCNIFAHPETQNTIWLPIYQLLTGSETPPCPECFPSIESSMIFGINVSYMLLFVLPLRCAAFAVPPCFATYLTFLVYARWNNYMQFGEGMANDVKILTSKELILLSGMLVFNITAKIIMETSETELWHSLKESQGTLLHEKILRCQAEYASECMKTTTTSYDKDKVPSSFCATSVDGHHQSSQSAASAPPILVSPDWKSTLEEHLLFEHASPCTGDCLQEDDFVWTDHSSHPIPVKKLSKGQRVLCYDRLSKGLKHAEVLNVAVQSDPVQWATITLIDGSSIRVTADHPFLTEAHQRLPSMPGLGEVPVRACELKPHISKILVMKLVPVDVHSVELDPLEDLKEQARVTVDIRQPTRHSVFVSSRYQENPGSAVAVGASNLDLMTQDYVIRPHQTFLRVFDSKPKLRRTNSSPGCLESSLENIPKVSVAQRGSISIKSSSSPSTMSSSATSLHAEHCTIRIGTELRPVPDASGCGRAVDAISAPDDVSRMGLQDYLRVQRSGIPSLGSFQHDQGACRACWFENQRQHGRFKNCSLGIMCDRCHFDHAFYKRTRRAGRSVKL